MNEKCKLHIFAVTALVIIIVLGACASTPKEVEIITYDTSIPDEQTASIFILPGWIEVVEFNGQPLNPKWYQMSSRSPGMLVKIPTGQHRIRFHYYGGGGDNAMNLRLNLDVVAGRMYYLSVTQTSLTEIFFTTYELMFSSMNTMPQREPGPDEQKLFIQLSKGSNGPIYILDKGTSNERRIMAVVYEDAYIIVPKGDHTLDIGLSDYYNNQNSDLSPSEEPHRNFTASSEPVRYIAELKITERASGFGNMAGKGNITKFTYKLTQK